MQPSCPCLFVFLEATEGVDRARDRREGGGGLAAKSRRESRFRETIRNQRSGKWVPSLPEHAPGESRRPVRIHGKGHEEGRDEIPWLMGGMRRFFASRSGTEQFFPTSMRTPLDHYCGVRFYPLSYRDIVVSRALYPFKSKVALLAQIFTLNELIDGRTTSLRHECSRSDEKTIIYSFSICLCMRAFKWTINIIVTIIS